ncbi:MAG: DUF1800 family protein [Bacteroidota bacterium]
MKKVLRCFTLLFFSICLHAQTHRDFVGAGHDNGIVVTTSHDENALNPGDSSVDGFEVVNTDLLADASRFLAQATMGYDYATIQMTAAMGFEAWIEEQFALPRQSYEDLGEIISEAGEAGQGWSNYRSAWWNYVLSAPDQLRQRINYNLSELLVVSGFGNDFFEDVGNLSNVYYDVLGENAFGNYRTLLRDISLNPSMGIYLSHLNNPRSDPANNIHPDENYAREVMQLFSIGLYELNNDGTRKLDGNGNFIPTYNNNDIREFAKIFTGFGDGRPEGQWGIEIGELDLDSFSTYPMKMYEQWHEPGEKRLLNGQIVPAGQSGLQDLESAMDNLHNHPNIGPFIGNALIQLLVTSNPTPQYISNVANAYNNNGSGVRGDMQAVIRAILLDNEARSCSPLNNPTAGKMREPLLRFTNYLRAFNAENQTFLIDNMLDWIQATGQAPVYASSVFNFFLPTYQPQGDIARANLVAPVFQIHNSSTSIGYVNKVNEWVFDETYMEITNPMLDFTEEMELVEDATALVNRLDILLACGQLSGTTKAIIVNTLEQLDANDDRLALGIYLTMIAPDYAILK